MAGETWSQVATTAMVIGAAATSTTRCPDRREIGKETSTEILSTDDALLWQALMFSILPIG